MRTEPTHTPALERGERTNPPRVDSFAPGALVERARAGDRRAFEAIYREHGPLVHAVLLARVPRADADDLCQEVFVGAWRRLGELRDPEALPAWLASIARSRARDWARAAARRRRRERAAARPEAAPARPDAPDGVLGAIRSLPEAYREPLVLRLVADMPGALIARRLGMTHGSVRVNLHKGMRLLRERLSEDNA